MRVDGARPNSGLAGGRRTRASPEKTVGFMKNGWCLGEI